MDLSSRIGAVAVIILTGCLPASAQFAGGIDPGLTPTLEMAVLHPTPPAVQDELTGCLVAPHMPYDLLKGNLALTDDQNQKLYDLECQAMSKIEPAISQLKAQQRNLQAMLTAPQLDAQKIRDLEKQIDQQKDSISDMALEQHLSSVTLLTADQRKELAMLMIKGRHSHHWW